MEPVFASMLLNAVNPGNLAKVLLSAGFRQAVDGLRSKPAVRDPDDPEVAELVADAVQVLDENVPEVAHSLNELTEDTRYRLLRSVTEADLDPAKVVLEMQSADRRASLQIVAAEKALRLQLDASKEALRSQLDLAQKQLEAASEAAARAETWSRRLVYVTLALVLATLALAALPFIVHSDPPVINVTVPAAR